MIKHVSSLGALMIAALLSGCGTTDTLYERQQQLAIRYLDPSTLVSDNYRAVEALMAQAGVRLTRDQPILVATLVDVDDLYSSSTLGRVSSENLASRVNQLGYPTVELKLGRSVYMKRNEGELVLTREIQSIAKVHDAQAVIVGTYGVARDTVMVNLKLVAANDSSLVLGSHDYVVRRVRDVDAMLKAK